MSTMVCYMRLKIMKISIGGEYQFCNLCIFKTSSHYNGESEIERKNIVNPAQTAF